jgi:hypothetical protein
LGFDANYGFHSFRSTLTNLFERAGVAENYVARIIGHKVESMSYGLYSEDISRIDKEKTMAWIEYKNMLHIGYTLLKYISFNYRKINKVRLPNREHINTLSTHDDN